MLYDNAQLARVVHPRLAADRRRALRQVVERDARASSRASCAPRTVRFASSLDADTDGEEGATYVWRSDEIDARWAPRQPTFEAAYGVTDERQLGRPHILSRADPGGRPRPTGARAARPTARSPPRTAAAGRDDKVLTAWNGLAIAAFADAARALGDAALGGRGRGRRRPPARPGARRPTAACGARGRTAARQQSGVLEDYANLADGLLALYEATFDERWFVAARELAEQILAHFGDPAGGFFDTADDHEALIARPKGLQDNAMPSGGAMADAGAAAAGRADRRGPLPRCRRVGAARRDRRRPPLPDRLRPVAGRVPAGASGRCSKSPSSATAQSLLATVNGKFRPLSCVAAKAHGRPNEGAPSARPAAARRTGHRLRLRRLCLPPTGHGIGRSRGSVILAHAMTTLSPCHSRSSSPCSCWPLSAPATFAHAALLESDPPDGGTIAAPYVLVFRFDDQLKSDGSSVVVRDGVGHHRGAGWPVA